MPEILEHALDGAIFAKRPVQRVEADIGLQLGQHRSHIGTDIDPGDLVPGALKRIGAWLCP
jgi:hypothetical protein